MIQKYRLREHQSAPILGIEQQTITVKCREVASDALDVLQYRNCFDPISENEVAQIALNPPVTLVSGANVVAPDGYFEDVSGRPITMSNIIAVLHGPDVVLFRDVDSLRKLGPTPLAANASWTQDDSDLMGHYISVIEQLNGSDWVTSESSITTQSGQGIVSSTFPHLHEMRSVLVLFRQLYADSDLDNLFEKVVNRYLSGCSSKSKAGWVKYELNLFNNILNNPIAFPLTTNPPAAVTGRDILESFGYGYRIFHASPRGSGVRDLRNLIADHGQHKIMLSLDFVLRHLASHCFAVYHAVKLDFDAWVEQNIVPPPQLLDFRELIGQ